MAENINTVDIEAITRLSKLSSFDYDRVRCEEANNLGVLVSTLDEAVKKERDQHALPQNNFIVIPTIEPWPNPVDGSELLTSLTNIIKKYIALNEHQASTIALWIVFTYCIDAFHISPILNISSPEKRCGKSTLLLLLQFLVKHPMTASNITPAAIFRTIEMYHPTLLLDEVDTFVRNDKSDLRGIINSGHTRSSAYVMRIVGVNNDPKQFSTWCAKCLAGIGRLPDTIDDRSIIIKLKRKSINEKVEKLRFKHELLFNNIKRKCIRFADDNYSALSSANPTTPIELNDRAADNWEPLLAIADIAGKAWREIADQAATHISGKEPEQISMPIQLLADIHKIFSIGTIEKISSADLVNRLCSDDEAPWKTYNQGSPFTQRQLAKKLNEFDIKSRDIRLSKDNHLKGYLKKSFKDAFDRYTPSTCNQNQSVTPRQTNGATGLSENSNATQPTMSPIESTTEYRQNKLCHGVTDIAAHEVRENG